MSYARLTCDCREIFRKKCLVTRNKTENSLSAPDAKKLLSTPKHLYPRLRQLNHQPRTQK